MQYTRKRVVVGARIHHVDWMEGAPFLTFPHLQLPVEGAWPG